MEIASPYMHLLLSLFLLFQLSILDIPAALYSIACSLTLLSVVLPLLAYLGLLGRSGPIHDLCVTSTVTLKMTAKLTRAT